MKLNNSKITKYGVVMQYITVEGLVVTVFDVSAL